MKKPKILDIDTFLMLSGRGDIFLIEFKETLIKDGYDGIVFEKPDVDIIKKYSGFIMDEFPTNQYVAFYNHQIKSIFEKIKQ